MLVDEYLNAGLFDLYQLLNSNGDLHSYDELAGKFYLTPNNCSFIKHIKLISAIPNSWLDNSATTQINFALFKNKVQIRERPGSQVWKAFGQDRLFCIDSVIMIRHLNPRSENILPSHDAQLKLQSVHEATQFLK